MASNPIRRDPFMMVPCEVFDMDHPRRLDFALMIGYLSSVQRSRESAWPHQETIADKFGKSVAWVRKLLTEMESVGLIEKGYRRAGNLTIGRTYRIRWADTSVEVDTSDRSSDRAPRSSPDRAPRSSPDRAPRSSLKEVDASREVHLENEKGSRDEPWVGDGQQGTENAQPDEASSSASPGSSKPASNDAKKGSDLVDESFAQFWDGYPRRNGVRHGKKDAAGVWRKLRPDQRAAAMAMLPKYRADVGDYPKDPVRYLRGELWNDYTDIERPPNKGSFGIGHGRGMTVDDFRRQAEAEMAERAGRAGIL